MTRTVSRPATRPIRTARRPRRRGRQALVVLVVVLLAAGAGWIWWRGHLVGITVRPTCTATANGSTATLTPEQAGNAATIAGVAVRRALPGRAATIGIATAMQESKLINLTAGDRDSIGLFQQRPSQGWGTAAQVHDPVYASNAFYDVLVKVEGYQSLSVTTAAQKVQRSAFPTAYADHEPEARRWASALTGYSPAGLTCAVKPLDLADESPDAGGLTPRARALTTAASAELGRPARVVPDSHGTQVRFAATSAEPRRLAWALAAWAVARADALAVVAVEVDGRQWTRAESTAGWTASGTAPTDGSVVVRVG